LIERRGVGFVVILCIQTVASNGFVPLLACVCVQSRRRSPSDRSPLAPSQRWGARAGGGQAAALARAHGSLRWQRRGSLATQQPSLALRGFGVTLRGCARRHPRHVVFFSAEIRWLFELRGPSNRVQPDRPVQAFYLANAGGGGPVDMALIAVVALEQAKEHSSPMRVGLDERVSRSLSETESAPG